VSRYSSCVPSMRDELKLMKDVKLACSKLLKALSEFIPIDGYQVGISKVFMKEQYRGVIEQQRVLGISKFVLLIQRMVRGHLGRKFVKSYRVKRTREIEESILLFISKANEAVMSDSLSAVESVISGHYNSLNKRVREETRVVKALRESEVSLCKLKYREESRLRLEAAKESDIEALEAAIKDAEGAGVKKEV
jgi:myosin heavy subunit